MELRIVGTQIWLNNILMSEGLVGPPYAAKLREVEDMYRTIKRDVDYATSSAYNDGYNDGVDDTEADENP